VRQDDELSRHAAKSEVAVRQDIELKLEDGYSKEALVRLKPWAELSGSEAEEDGYSKDALVRLKLWADRSSEAEEDSEDKVCSILADRLDVVIVGTK
jgi:hypothetical protein